MQGLNSAAYIAQTQHLLTFILFARELVSSFDPEAV